MELLRDSAGDGFPADYLLARVRGRRARLISDWPALIGRAGPPEVTDESIWGALLAEMEWLHGQMNGRLRRCLGPVLALFELKTIVLCVRNKAAERAGEVERLLARSLLGDRLKLALRTSPDVRSAVATTTEVLAEHAAELRELSTAYAEKGLQGFEDGLVRGYLTTVGAQRLHPVVRRFFEAFIDLRNLMMLYKHLRWSLGEEIPWITGGTIEPARLEEAASRGDFAGLEALAREATGLDSLPPAASEGSLETVLLASLTRKLKQSARTGPDVGLILDYAWRSYVQARNLAVLCHAGELEAATLERELIA